MREIMVITIIDEDGVHTVEDDETVMCENCFATNDATHKKCSNCGGLLNVRRKRTERILPKM
jgi:hypothetical protein